MTETHYEKVSATENEKEKIDTKHNSGYGVRHEQALLFFMSLALGYISRGHLGVTIVAMTHSPPENSSANGYYNKCIVINTNNSIEAINDKSEYDKDLENFLGITDYNDTKILRVLENKKAKVDINSTSESKVNFIKGANSTSTNLNEDNSKIIWNIYKTYGWPKSTQEMVQGAFFLGYFIMMFPTGLVVQRWGGKLPLQIALFINGIFSILVPWITAWGGWKAICVCRLVQGFSQAGFYPAVHSLLANWAPVSERGTLTSYVYTGSGFGTIVAFQLAGVLADSRWGWPSSFWVTGLMCLVGFSILTIFLANKPAEHKSVSEQEKSYICGHSADDNKQKPKTPWKKILSSGHVWACFCGHVGSGVTYVFFFMQVPTYMHNILHFNIRNSGLLSSLPYIFTFLATIAFGHLTDFCSNRKIFSIKNMRKIMNTIGGVGSAICIGAVTFAQDSSLAVFLFTTSLAFHSAGHTGWMLNYIDLAPRYSGALMAIGNTLCNSVIIILPLIVSSIVTDVKNPYQWRIVFLLMAGLAFVANTFYVLFMSADVQSWNDIDDDNEPEEVKLEEHPEKK